MKSTSGASGSVHLSAANLQWTFKRKGLLMYKPEPKYHSHNVLPLKTSKGLSNSAETSSPGTEAWAESFLSPPSGSSIMDGSLYSSQSSDAWIHNINEVVLWWLYIYMTRCFTSSQNDVSLRVGHSLIKWSPWSILITWYIVNKRLTSSCRSTVVLHM